MASSPGPSCAISAAPRARRCSWRRGSMSEGSGMRVIVAALLSCGIAGTALAEDIRVLSAGAVELGLAKITEQFRRETGNRVRVTFGTAPQLERRLNSDDSADVLICAPGLMNDQLRRGKIEVDGHMIIGRVGVG